MYHSITFGTKNTWTDWKLVPTSRPVIDPPPVKKVMVDIPGADGSIDLTESLTGFVRYENRKGSFEFKVHTKEDWVEVYSSILDYLHGQRLKIFLVDDPGYYYYGRASINTWKTNKNYSLITIDVETEPYKYEMYSSTEDWEWDPFNFETGIIREYKDIRIDGDLTYTIDGNRRPVVPTITVSSDDGAGIVAMPYDNAYAYKRFTLADGVNHSPYLVIKEGRNRFRFTGNGTITIDYRRGSL